MKHFRNLLTLLLLFFCGSHVCAQNIEIEYEGFEYEGLFFKITNLEEKTVSVAGAYDDGVIEIPEKAYCSDNLFNGIYTVTGIFDNAFSNDEDITGIEIPNTITYIGESAFNGCSSLRTISIPNSVRTVGYGAFLGCDSLKQVTIEDGETTLHLNQSNSGYAMGVGPWCYGTFYYCPLERVYLGRNITYPNTSPGFLITSPFNHHPNLNDVRIGDAVTEIGDDLFAYCPSIREIKLPKDVTRIGINAFKSCTNLTGIQVPDKVTEIGDGAFFECNVLAEVNFGNAVESIGEHAFWGCTALKDIVLPNSVKHIKKWAFQSCSNITSVTMGEGVQNIDEDAFSGCEALKEVRINNLTAWCNIDFAGNQSNPLYYAKNLYLKGTLLTDLVIPNDVTVLKPFVFRSCASLKSLTLHNNIISIGQDAFNTCLELTGELKLPQGLTSIGSYAFASCEKLIGELVIPNKISAVPDFAFINCIGITDLKIGDSVTSIGNESFRNCYKLETVDLGKNLQNIGGNAFYNCSNIQEVVIPEEVTTIGGGAFNSCGNLNKVTMGKSVQTIGEYAFWWSSNIREVHINDLAAWMKIDFRETNSNPTVYSRALFLYGELMTDLVIPNEITEIKTNAFYNCSCLNSITIHNRVTSIGHYAFQGCTGLLEVTIPNSVTQLGYSVFRECTGIKSVTIGDGISNIPGGTFYRCYNLNTMTFGLNLETVEPEAIYSYNLNTLIFNTRHIKDWFRDKREIKTIVLGDSVRSTAEGSFAHCDISAIHIPKYLTSIGDYTFSWNKNLKSITVDADNPVYKVPKGYNVLLDAENTVVLAAQGAKLPKDISRIGNGAFNGLLGIKTITLPVNLDSIGEWAFDGCSDLKTIRNYSDLQLVAGTTDHGYVAYYADTIINKAGIIDNYVFAIDGENYKLIDYVGDEVELALPDNFKGSQYAIDNDAFKGNANVESITLSDGVTVLGDSAFAHCPSLHTLNISSSVKKIGLGILYGNSSLEHISVDENNEFFDSRNDCNAIISKTEYISGTDGVLLPQLNTLVGKTYILECPLFYNTQGIRKAAYNNNGSVMWKTLDESDLAFRWQVVATENGYAFKNEKDGRYLKSKTQNEQVWFVEDNSLNGEFTILQVGEGQVAISINSRHLHAGDHSSGNGEEGRIISYETNRANSASSWVLLEVQQPTSYAANTLLIGCKQSSIPNSVTTIGRSAFKGVSDMENIMIPESVIDIQDWAFADCSGLTTLEIPASVKHIGQCAFSGCEGLSNIYSAIPSNMLFEIDDSTFMGAYDATLYVTQGAEEFYATTKGWSNFGNIVETGQASFDLVVSSAGYATLYLNYDTAIPEGVEVYTATEIDGGALKMELVKDVLPANTGVVVKAPAGTYTFTYTATDVPAIPNNLFKGSVVNEYINVPSNSTAFVLSKVNGEVGMYPAKLTDGSFLNNANKAYLLLDNNKLGLSDEELDTSVGGAQLSLRFDFGDTTGVDEVQTETGVNNAIYDMYGRKVNTITTPGLYIVNGKKVWVK